MLRRSLITFALVVSGLLITTAAGTTIQRQDLAGSRTSMREKVNTVSSSNDLLDATAAKAPASQAAAHPQWSVRTVSVTKPTSAASSSQTAASTSVASSAPASQQAVATSDSFKYRGFDFYCRSDCIGSTVCSTNRDCCPTGATTTGATTTGATTTGATTGNSTCSTTSTTASTASTCLREPRPNVCRCDSALYHWK